MLKFCRSHVSVKLVGAAVLSASLASCRTTAPAKVKSALDVGDIPAMTFANVDRAMVDRVVEWARPNAEAMFGGKAYFQLVIFDDVIRQGPCQSVLGARIIFANGAAKPDADRPFVMAVLDPVNNGTDNCVYASATSPKKSSDVGALVYGSRNFEAKLGGSAGINLTLMDAINNVKKAYPSLNAPSVVSLMNPDVPGMVDHPWAMVSGTACGMDAVVYVNLTTGSLLPGPKPIKPTC